MKSRENSSEFTCPNCGQIQYPPNRDRFDSWNCSYCYSGFLSIQMLINLAPRSLIAQIDNPSSQVGISNCRCPECRGPMDRVHIDFHEKQAEIDVCRPCRLVWFNSGDLLRALRHEAPEEITRSVVKPRAKAHLREVPIAEPWYTYAILVICGVVGPLAVNRPEIVERFGFFRAEPFRFYGLTWLTSLFVHDSMKSLLLGMSFLYVMGSYVERNLGAEKYLRLFLVSGVAGRFVWWLFGAKADTLTVGASCGICGVAACFFLTFPFLKFLFPEERERSPANGFAWLVVIGVFLIGCYICWNFIAVIVHQVAQGSDYSSPAGTLIADFQNWFGSASFDAHLVACLLGIVWSVGQIRKVPKGT